MRFNTIIKKHLAIIVVGILYVCSPVSAQHRNDLWQRAETAVAAGKYKQAFEQLHDFERSVSTNSKLDDKAKAAERYKAARTRMNIYIKMRKPKNAKEQLEKMERQANIAASDSIQDDLLFNKAVCYYATGQTDKGNAAFNEMAAKLIASKDYDKVNEAYQTLIANGRKVGNANIVAQAYSSYIAWKDSMDVLKTTEETKALKQQILDGETSIAEKDKSLATRRNIIISLCTLLAALVAALVCGVLQLMRCVRRSRKRKKDIRLLNEAIAQKAKFTGNISAQLTPALQKLDTQQPEVKALLDFTRHIQTLSQLEASTGETLEKEETNLPAFSEDILNQIRGKVKSGVVINTDIPKTSITLNREYVTHILLHLLNNAAEYTPEGGHIRLEFKRRSVHKYQFHVSNTGPVIPEEKRESIFNPFHEVRDLTTGDGLELPICRQMARKMDGDLCIDPEFTKGTRFILTISA